MLGMIVLLCAVPGVILVLAAAVLGMIVLGWGLLRGGRPAESHQQNGERQCGAA